MKRPLAPRSTTATTMKRHIIVFSRYPEPHTTKTRLIPALGAEGAADLQRAMTRHTLAAVRATTHSTGAIAEVRFEGGDARRMATCFGKDLQYHRQGTGDLGNRMDRAFSDAFSDGADQVVMIGTDCPELTPDLLADAFTALERNDLVLGPADDGGYYLIGLSHPARQLFVDMPWGNDGVLDRTLQQATELQLTVSTLETLSDVDRPEDLAVWQRIHNQTVDEEHAPQISIVIPALNDVDYLPRTLASLQDRPDTEIIVVDGGSHDQTPTIARQAGCRLLRAPANRALQMNAGARAARGKTLLFLHADTLLPEAYNSAIQSTLSQPGVVAGAFRLRIDAPNRLLRLVERAIDFRARLLQMPYGDQAIFVNREVFQRVGQFLECPIMEDFELIRRLRRFGSIRISPLSVITSGRRWMRLGVWRTTWINQKIILGYYLGVSPERLAKWYGDTNEDNCR